MTTKAAGGFQSFVGPRDKSGSRPYTQVWAGLDLGSTKVSFIIGQSSETGVQIVGIGTAPNTGVRQGAVVDIESTVEAIKKAREEAELMAGQSTNQVWMSVGGQHVQSFDSQGMVAIRNKEVSKDDIKRVFEAAKAVAIPADRKLIHVLPKGFRVDGQEGIKDPLGMAGVRLECSVHIVTAQLVTLQNAIRCLEKAGLELRGMVLQQLASATAIATQDEKNLGVGIVDVGGGTSDVILFVQGHVVHTGSIPVGGHHFTQDVAMGLRTTQISAESLKRKQGYALPNLIQEESTLEVEGVGGRTPRVVPHKHLGHILEARAEETLNLIRQEILSSGYMNHLGSGLVLTGGASQLKGLLEMGDYIFDVPVRLGVPQKTGGLSDVVKDPSYSTAVGVILYAANQSKETDKPLSALRLSSSTWLHDWSRRLKDILSVREKEGDSNV